MNCNKQENNILQVFKSIEFLGFSVCYTYGLKLYFRIWIGYFSFFLTNGSDSLPVQCHGWLQSVTNIRIYIRKKYFLSEV